MPDVNWSFSFRSAHYKTFFSFNSNTLVRFCHRLSVVRDRIYLLNLESIIVTLHRRTVRFRSSVRRESIVCVLYVTIVLKWKKTKQKNRLSHGQGRRRWFRFSEPTPSPTMTNPASGFKRKRGQPTDDVRRIDIASRATWSRRVKQKKQKKYKKRIRRAGTCCTQSPTGGGGWCKTRIRTFRVRTTSSWSRGGSAMYSVHAGIIDGIRGVLLLLFLLRPLSRPSSPHPLERVESFYCLRVSKGINNFATWEIDIGVIGARQRCVRKTITFFYRTLVVIITI